MGNGAVRALPGDDMLVAISNGGFDLNALDHLSDTDQKTVLAFAMRVVDKLWQPRVLTGDKYREAWKLLRPDERTALEAALFDFKIAVQKLKGMFADFVFDESNWRTTDNHRKSVVFALIDPAPEYKEKRQPILQFFRELRKIHAVSVMEMVNKHATRIYSDIPGTPGPIEVTREEVFQHVPDYFEGKSGLMELSFSDSPKEVKQVFRDATNLINSGYEPCGPGFDGTVSLVAEAEINNKGMYSYYLAARGIILQDRFHKAVSEAVQCVDGVEFLPGRHKRSERFMSKGAEYAQAGVPDPAHRAIKDTVRGSIVCRDHAAMVSAHAALLAASKPFEGKVTKDRREDPSCRDLLQVVLFDGLLCEVQFHFASTLPLKAFSHAAYNLRRPDDKDLGAFKTLFEYPSINMQDHTRSADSIKCKLHF